MKISDIIENKYIKNYSQAILELFSDIFTALEAQNKSVLEVNLSKEDLELVCKYCPEIVDVSFSYGCGEPVGYLWGAEVYLREGQVGCFPDPVGEEAPKNTLAVASKRIL